MRSKVLFGAFVLVAVVAAFALLFGGERKPKIEGKPVAHWLDEMIAGGAPSNAAIAVFVKAGSSAVPALTNELRFVPATRTNLIQLKARLPWAIASRMPKAPLINWPR